jgi:tetratricopeptide (TPR) repeat protein
MGLLFARSRSSSEIPFIGNDLSNLSVEIRRNYFTCARAGSDEDVPIKSGLLGLKRRMGLIKLIHQADQLGLRADSNVPWNLSFKGHLQMRVAKCDVYSYGAAHDLIPDPSDWVPFHPLMANPPHKCGMQFIKRSKQFYYETYFDKSIHPAKRALLLLNASDAESKNIEETPSNLDGDDKPRSTRAWDILYCTVLLLKEAGNLALQKSLNCLAARYYDKAIVYCSVAYLQFPVGNCSFLAQHQIVLSENSGCECRWTSLLKTLIQIRLNMALCCLKNDVNDPKAAISQAKLALKELKPFVAQKGCVLTGKKLERPRLEEPPTTYVEATALQSKAFFRLGSAQLLMGDFDAAIESFEQSIKSSNASSPDSKPDPIILRKLQEAKLTSRRHSNSERKKFKFAFSSKNDESKEAAEGKNTCNEH